MFTKNIDFLNAVKINDIDKVKKMFSSYLKPKINYVDSKTKSALVYAFELNYFQMVDLLLEYGSDINISFIEYEKNQEGKELTDQSIIRFKETTLLNEIIEKQDINKLDFILTKKPNINKYSKITFNSNKEIKLSPIMNAIKTKNPVIINKILSCNPDLSFKNNYMENAFIYAINTQNKKIIEMLLLSGNIDLNEKDINGHPYRKILNELNIL